MYIVFMYTYGNDHYIKMFIAIIIHCAGQGCGDTSAAYVYGPA